MDFEQNSSALAVNQDSETQMNTQEHEDKVKEKNRYIWRNVHPKVTPAFVKEKTAPLKSDLLKLLLGINEHASISDCAMDNLTDMIASLAERVLREADSIRMIDQNHKDYINKDEIQTAFKLLLNNESVFHLLDLRSKCILEASKKLSQDKKKAKPTQ